MAAPQDTAAAEDTSAERPSSSGLLLAFFGLAWMAGLLWSARHSILAADDAEMQVTSTAYALPGAISASLIGGASVALAVLTMLTRRRTLGTTVRFAVSTGTGLVLGLLGALPIITINTAGWVYAVVGGTIAGASTIGGALGGFRVPRVVAAVCWGGIAVFVVGFLINVLPVYRLFSSGDSASQVSKAGWFGFLQAAISGLAAGVVSFLSLRRARRMSDDADVRWPLYAVAGAGPGLLLILAEGLARIGGARVIDLAGQVSELERSVQTTLSGSRLNSALITFFIGALTAIILIGRTLGPPPETED
jgi:iron complex transport system permease protein